MQGECDRGVVFEQLFVGWAEGGGEGVFFGGGWCEGEEFSEFIRYVIPSFATEF